MLPVRPGTQASGVWAWKRRTIRAYALCRSARAKRARGGDEAGPRCRLYSKEYFTKEMPAETVPEIRRTALISTVLSLKRLGIDDVLHFDYMDPPEPDRLVDALKVRHRPVDSLARRQAPWSPLVEGGTGLTGGPNGWMARLGSCSPAIVLLGRDRCRRQGDRRGRAHDGAATAPESGSCTSRRGG